jgi:hypothetical protein
VSWLFLPARSGDRGDIPRHNPWDGRGKWRAARSYEDLKETQHYTFGAVLADEHDLGRR